MPRQTRIVQLAFLSVSGRSWALLCVVCTQQHTTTARTVALSTHCHDLKPAMTADPTTAAPLPPPHQFWHAMTSTASTCCKSRRRSLGTDPYDALTGESQLQIVLVLPDQHGARADSRLLWTRLPAVNRSSFRACLGQHSPDSPSSLKQESTRNLVVAATNPQKRYCAMCPRQIRP